MNDLAVKNDVQRVEVKRVSAIDGLVMRTWQHRPPQQEDLIRKYVEQQNAFLK